MVQDRVGLQYPLTPSIYFLLRRGILGEANGNLEFAAPLLRSLFMHRLFWSPCKADTLADDIDKFVLNSLCHLNSSTIVCSLGSEERAIQRTWQLEYYKAATTALPTGHLAPDACAIFPSEDECGGSETMLFCISEEKDWAIETIWEGGNATEHEQRFDPLNGRYKDIPIRK